MKIAFKTVARAEQVAAHLRDVVMTRIQPGKPLAPVRELAAELGVSVPTVRAAQARLMREGLLEVRHGSGVFVVEKVARSQWVGLYTALDILHPRTSSFHTHLPRALRKFLNRHGFQVEIYLGVNQPDGKIVGPGGQRLCADIAEGRLQGLVLMNAPGSQAWTHWVAGLQIPVVGALTPYRVEPTYDAMIRQSVQCLYEGGSRRIAMLSWNQKGLINPLQEALTNLGLEYHPEWTRCDLHPMLSGGGWEEFRELWMARREKPDGLVVTDDVLFDEAQIAIQEMGIRVPAQLRVVAYANKGAVKRYPFPVILAECDPEYYAAQLGGMLIRRLSGDSVVPPIAWVPIEMTEPDQAVRVSAPARSLKGETLNMEAE